MADASCISFGVVCFITLLIVGTLFSRIAEKYPKSPLFRHSVLRHAICQTRIWLSVAKIELTAAAKTLHHLRLTNQGRQTFHVHTPYTGAHVVTSHRVYSRSTISRSYVHTCVCMYIHTYIHTYVYGYVLQPLALQILVVNSWL
jgi:hypothetical protein